jgi:succinate-semialdehyde dehydrogenase/glutarate-semialdehyde dehydrogenase
LTTLFHWPTRTTARKISVSEYRVINPATNELEREFPTATEDDIESVLARSHETFASWRRTDKSERAKLQLVASIYRYYADQGPGLLADTPPHPAGGGRAVVRKEPVGSLLGIMPWNYPYYQVARFAAPNLMIGNTIILKHAPQCPESAASR